MVFPVYLAAISDSLKWLRHLGGPGLVLLGIADSSVIPSTGSMDVLTILLTAHHRDRWPYYAVMATIGSLIGSYITYSLARKGGKEALERRLSPSKASRVFKKFEEHGFMAVVIPALLPPPFPFVPFLLAAGALQSSCKKFIGALALGRGIRFSILACLGAIYGRHITTFFTKYYKPTLAILVLLAVLGGVVGLIQYIRYRKNQTPAAV
jgi:membrane protein DedA with SNARE-associated domain